MEYTAIIKAGGQNSYAVTGKSILLKSTTAPVTIKATGFSGVEVDTEFREHDGIQTANEFNTIIIKNNHDVEVTAIFIVQDELMQLNSTNTDDKIVADAKFSTVAFTGKVRLTEQNADRIGLKIKNTGLELVKIGRINLDQPLNTFYIELEAGEEESFNDFAPMALYAMVAVGTTAKVSITEQYATLQTLRTTQTYNMTDTDGNLIDIDGNIITY